MNTETRVENGLPVTLASITADLANDDLTCLYYATEAQIGVLIDMGRINEDYASRHQDYQEEMRCLIAEAQAEFGG